MSEEKHGSQRTYLFVPFEEKDEVSALGAHWDAQAKCWYLEAGEDAAPFDRWLGAAAEDEYAIVSDRAYIACALTACWKCRAKIEVVCVYCEAGSVRGDRYTQFSVSDITSVDSALERQLGAWPHFRFATSRSFGYCLANHCPQCGAVQSDYFLHCVPGGAFFTIKGGGPERIRLTPLQGPIRLNGDEGFEPE
jgi:hypothetical protein